MTLTTDTANGSISDRSGIADIVNSQFGWHLQNRNIDLFVTERGGQMAPVFFFNDTDVPIQPYYISPWQDEVSQDIEEPCLLALRGDFFCMPFGADKEEFEQEKYPVHGETAGAVWALEKVVRDTDRTTLSLKLKTTGREESVIKQLSVVNGHNVIYCRHILSGYSGLMPLGHHAIIAMPEENGGMLLSLGEFELGMTHPTMFADPADREYQQLAFGREFTDLSHLPLQWQEPAFGDYSVYPSPIGYTDLFCVLKNDRGTPAWATATYPQHGYLWFALKDPIMLPATCVWVSNCGRHSAPWNGRNRCIGIEDVCAYFDYGRKASVEPNRFTAHGFSTAVRLDPDNPLEINYIQGVTRTPSGFGKTVRAEFGDHRVTFIDQHGLHAEAEVDYGFLLPS